MAASRVSFHFLPLSHCVPGDWVTMNSLTPLTFFAGILYSCISQAQSAAVALICASLGASAAKLPATAMLTPWAIHG